MEYVPLFGVLFIRVPVMLVWLVGIGVAIWKWKTSPHVSLLACIALLMMLFEALAGGLLSYVFPLMMSGQPDIGPMRVAYLVSAVGLIQGLLEAIAWGIVIVAVFGWRRQSEQKATSIG